MSCPVHGGLCDCEPAPAIPVGSEARCEKCGSADIELDGWDIDKCRACGHWRYR